jgi:LDH2 family malate/lactate/ureidoglycolate dehydrogenase
MIEILSAALSGAGLRWEVGSWIDADPSQPTHHGAAFLAINIGAIMPLELFKKRIDQMIRDIHEVPRARGVERVYMPGEMEWQNRQEALAQGIPLPDDVLASLRSLAEELDLKAQWLAD